MAVRHGVTDADKHFIIDPVTRTITNQSGKLVLIQYDHNSERFTFECPRHIDEHDMSLCNKVEIHYINTGTGNSKSTGIYETDDLQISEDGTDNVTFSWLISQNATRHVGKLHFVIRFACVADDTTIEYAWNTGIYSDIAIAKSIYNGEEFVEDYIDVLEMWKQDLYSEGLKIASVEQTTTSTEDSGINIITMTMTDGSTKTFQIQNGSKGNDGSSIASIDHTSRNGLVDTYTITLTDGSTTTFQVYNGANGSSGDGSGDMATATYDPQGKRTDIFKYVDDKVAENDTSGSSITVDTALSETSTNPVQNKVIKSALDNKQDIFANTLITNVICYNISLNSSNNTYTLPSAITLDENALYYAQVELYTADGAHIDEYSFGLISKVFDSKVQWATAASSASLTLTSTSVTNTFYEGASYASVYIYEIKSERKNDLLKICANSEGYDTVSSGIAAHAEGFGTRARGRASHTEGSGTIASSNYQHVHGKFNVEDTNGTYIHIVGNGSSDTERSNAHTLDWEGNAWFAGNITGKQANVTEQVLVDNGTNRMATWPNGIAGDPKEGTDESKLWIGSDGHGYFTNLYICTGDTEKEVATKDDITAAITGAIEGSY